MGYNVHDVLRIVIVYYIAKHKKSITKFRRNQFIFKCSYLFKKRNMSSIYFFIFSKTKLICHIHSKRSQGSCRQCLKLHLHYFEKSPLIVFNELFYP